MVTSLDPSVGGGIPDDGSVTTIKLADNAVTDPKIATQVSSKISGFPQQTQALDMGTFNVDDTSVLGLNGVPTQGQTGSPSFGRLFLDTDVSNHLSIIKNADAIDIEAPGLGINTGENSITASTTQSQGEGPLTKVINEISTVANNDDVVTLPTAVPFLKAVVINNGIRRIQIFPASGDDLGTGVNNSITLMANSNIHFVAYDDTNWELT